jgi:hypothetical protein
MGGSSTEISPIKWPVNLDYISIFHCFNIRLLELLRSHLIHHNILSGAGSAAVCQLQYSFPLICGYHQYGECEPLGRVMNRRVLYAQIVYIQRLTA